ncbi:MAG: hypothetical protein HY855_16505 [Burkholderiales bacterium]|nr:hypothetical protein [Burkholderiales bacterium]
MKSSLPRPARMKRTALYLIAALAAADVLGTAWLWSAWQDRRAASAADSADTRPRALPGGVATTRLAGPAARPEADRAQPAPGNRR